jgi:hypothetical protein
MPGSPALSRHVAKAGATKPLIAAAQTLTLLGGVPKLRICSIEIVCPTGGMRNFARTAAFDPTHHLWLFTNIRAMHEIIYLIGLVVVVMFVLGLVGVR